MIDSIHIASIATYGANEEILDGLSLFNYIYGSNGSGKTTISRIIADPTSFPSCQVQWKAGNVLQVMVYNHDFIERNFNQTKELRGVFTLGETQTEILDQIAILKKHIDDLSKKNSGLLENLQGTDGNGGKRTELATLEAEFKELAWELKKKYDGDFSNAFEGLRSNSEKFRDRFLLEYKSNKASLLTFEELKSRSLSLFGSNPTKEPTIDSFDATELVEISTSMILSKPIIGKNDVDIAAMIEKLGNSDWVKSGKAYFEVNDGICPFCQQPTQDSFAKSLGEYFDLVYLNDMDELDKLYQKYESDYKNIKANLEAIQSDPSRFLDTERFLPAMELFLEKCTLNLHKLKEKKTEPSRIVRLETQQESIVVLSKFISDANSKIAEHNDMVANLGNEKGLLISQVWRLLLEEARSDYTKYSARKDSLKKAITGIESQIQANNTEKQEKEKEVRSLEKQTTSIQPTIDGINALLRQFGFSSFVLGRSASGTSYQLLRPNGMEAKPTLSEGEKSFVCFLYFYYLLKGSVSESGITSDRVVVLDDPVSSLDSDILFIVSSLIKGLFNEVRNSVGSIKQVFILTHNVYFHKEITFNPKRKNNQAMNEESFWTVRKTDLESHVIKWNENPVKTSYDLLWAEVRSTNKSTLTIQNTLRRILENYFKILGGVDPDELCDMFVGREKLICKSLFSWVNDGSHFAQDDLYMVMDSSIVETYLSVFRSIFEKSNHLAHYKMMMGEAFIESTIPTTC